MLMETNVFNAPLPGTTLRIITEEWKVLSEFHALMRQRMKLEAEHLLRLRRFQDSIDPTWSKSGVWTLISPVVELWSSQMDILEECSKLLNATVEACPEGPSPDELEEDILTSSRYETLHSSYKAYQDCQTAANSKEGITAMQIWFQQNRYKESYHMLEPLPVIDRKYRESVVVQRNSLSSITDWHSKRLPEKLEAHVGYAEATQTCLRDYLVESSRFASDLVRSISTAQNRLAEFSSLSFIDTSQKRFENESSHYAFHLAVYLNHGLGGVPAEPVLGVISYLPKLLEIGRERVEAINNLPMRTVLEMEKECTNFDETIQRLIVRYEFDRSSIVELTMRAIGLLLPMDDDTIRRYKNGIKRDEIGQLLQPFPIEDCRTASAVMATMYLEAYSFSSSARWLIGSWDAGQLLEDIWRKWDFDNHRPLPREVVRTLLDWNVRTKKVEGGELVFKKTGLPYNLQQ